MNIVEDNAIEEIFEKLHVFKEGDAMLNVKNRFSGASVTLTPKAEAMYSFIIGCELYGHWDDMRLGIDWFRENYPKEYMILLD